MEFPVKTDFFPQVRLTSEERRRYVAIGEQSARALRSSIKTLDWKKTMEKDGVTYAQAHYIEGSSLNSPSSAIAAASKANNEPEATASACLIMSATTFAAGTIGEALEALASPVTEDYRRVMRFLHGSSFVDGVCLHTITGNDSDTGPNNTKFNSQAFTTVKWAAFDDGKAFNAAGSPAGTDYCFLEHSGIHRSERGINGVAVGSGTDLFGFSIQESIVRDREVPSLTGVGLVRGHLHRTGILILPTVRPDVIQITSILQTRMAEGAVSDGSGPQSSSGKTSVLALARQMRQRVAAVGRLYLLLERRRLSKLEHVPRANWVPDEARKTCAVCVKPFALRRRKHHCRHCGEVVCSSCAPARDVDLNTTTPRSTINVRICTACVVQSRSGAQGHDSYDIFVHRLRDTGSTPTFRSSTKSAGSLTSADNNNAECKSRLKSVSSVSSTFSISSDSQISARLTGEDYADGSISFYDYGNDPIDASSSTSSIDSSSRSSIDSLSDLDAFDSFTSSLRSSQDEIDRQYWRYRRSSQWSDCSRPDAGSTLPKCTSNLGNPESPGKLLERIRGMKADLFTLTTSYRHFSDTSNFSIGSSSAISCVDDEDVTVCRMTWSAPLSLEFKVSVHEDSRQRTRSTYCEGTDEATNVDFINNSEQFTLLCPETLSRQWRTRTSSQVQQDAGEKFHLSLSLSSMSFVSTLSNLTMLGDEEDLERHETREFKGVEASKSQGEMQVLQYQSEGLDRSLTTATSQIDNCHTREVSRRTCPVLVDPVAARQQVIYRLLVEELHEIIGLPRPGQKH